MEATKQIALDMLAVGIPPAVEAKQNDTARVIGANLYAGGNVFDVPVGAIVVFRYRKPDGTAGFYDALPDDTPAISIERNVVTILLVEQVLTVPGDVQCEINLYNTAGEKLTTFTFCLRVQASVLTDAEIISSDYFNVLSEKEMCIRDRSNCMRGQWSLFPRMKTPAYRPEERSLTISKKENQNSGGKQ